MTTCQGGDQRRHRNDERGNSDVITKREPDLSVASARTAGTADSADTADTANSANSANSANTAATADKANNVLSAAVSGGCDVEEATQPGTTATPASSMAPAASACNVDFSRNVRACIYTATIGEPPNGFSESARGFITTAPTSGNPESVFVRTTNVVDNLAIRAFHLQVVC